MLSQADNQTLTRVGPSTPLGGWFRRFWLPALLSDEVAPGGSPVRVRLLGEDLLAYRTADGAVALVDACGPHRGAPLFYGRCEDGGLRCVYHGWKFAPDGTCLEIPNAPEGANYKERVRLGAYPAHDAAGMIWAYLGPADRQPPFPAFEWLDLPRDHRYVQKVLHRCNYLQALEGDVDMTHLAFLHSTLDGNRSNPALIDRNAQLLSTPIPTTLALEETDYGLRWEWGLDLTGSRPFVGVIHVIWPAFITVGLSVPGIQPVQIRVPIDDETSWMYRVRWSEQPLPDSVVADYEHGSMVYPPLIPGTFEPRENRQNDYLIDRLAQKHYSFTGISSVTAQDLAIQEDQRGPIMDRTQEHLVSTDDVIIKLRRVLLEGAAGLARGQEPTAPWQAASARTLRSASRPVPPDGSVESTRRDVLRLGNPAGAAVPAAVLEPASPREPVLS